MAPRLSTNGAAATSGYLSTRKLSVVVQLTSPEEYEGGDFETFEGKVLSAPKGHGTVLIFPSFVYHHVTPVTAGTRHSLVCWVNGPHIR